MAGFNNDGELYDAAFYAEIGQDTLGNNGNASTLPDRSTINNGLAPASGVVTGYLTYLPAGTVINRLTFRTSTGATGVTSWWLSIANAAFTVVAETADQGATTLTGFTNFTVALPSAYVVPVSGIYYFTLTQVGTVPALIVGSNTTASPAFVTKPAHNWSQAGLTGPVGVGYTYSPAANTIGLTMWILSS